MSGYRLVALIADLNTLSCVNTQVYQSRGVLVTKVALHIFSFLALATHKKGVFHATQGRNTPTKKHKKAATPPPSCAWLFLCSSVLCYGYWFSFTAAAALWLHFRFARLSFWLGLGCSFLLLYLCLAGHHRHYYHLITIGSKEHW